MLKIFSEIRGPPPHPTMWESGKPFCVRQEAQGKSRVREEPTPASGDCGAMGSGRTGSRGVSNLIGTSWLGPEDWLGIGSPPPEHLLWPWESERGTPGLTPNHLGLLSPTPGYDSLFTCPPSCNWTSRRQGLGLFPLNPSCLTHQYYWNEWRALFIPTPSSGEF